MGLFSCCGGALATLSRSAAKAAAARLRDLGIGSVHPRWPDRAAICEACHMRVIHRGVTYCGNPLLQQIGRDPVADGCGCPTRHKARSPREHCPIDQANGPAVHVGRRCTCKWCAIG